MPLLLPLIPGVPGQHGTTARISRSTSLDATLSELSGLQLRLSGYPQDEIYALSLRGWLNDGGPRTRRACEIVVWSKLVQSQCLIEICVLYLAHQALREVEKGLGGLDLRWLRACTDGPCHHTTMGPS